MCSAAALFFLLFTGQILAGQKSPAVRTVTESVARQNLFQHSEPIYPPIARAAGIEGEVEKLWLTRPDELAVQSRILHRMSKIFDTRADSF
jgi:hypothetical protein